MEEPRKPGPEHRRLDAFIGRWQGKGHNLEGAELGAGEPIETDESYAWMPGGFFVEHRGRLTFGDFVLESLHVIEADAESQTYPSNQYDSMGFCRTYVGQVNGAVWTFRGRWEQATLKFSDGGKALHVRWEVARDGAIWLPLCEYRATRSG